LGNFYFIQISGVVQLFEDYYCLGRLWSPVAWQSFEI